MKGQMEMLTYSFENTGSDSLYQYLYKCIKNDIISGSLRKNEKLPSKRAFADHLGISTITVENAYAQLVAEGYLYSLPKKGYYVSEINPQWGYYDLEEKAKKYSTVPFKNEVEHVQSREYFADFSGNRTEHFPFSIWAKIIRELLSENQQALMTNPPAGGIYELREAIASHLRAFRGMQVEPEQIIIGAGTEYLYGLLIQLLGFDRKYGVENPGYRKIRLVYQSHGVHCVPVAMDHHGILVHELDEKEIDIIHISPSHHFPTGRIMPVSRRYELLGWAAKSESRYIIEDDYDSEFRLVGKPIPAMQSIDLMEKVIYMNTFTKTLSRTVRISYMVLPVHLIQKFHCTLAFYSGTVSNFEQYTLAKFISEGYFEKHINRMRNYYHNKRDKLLQALKESRLCEYVTIMEEDAGLHFLMKINTDMSDAEFVGKCSKKDIRIVPLSDYYTVPPREAEHVFIVNYSSLPEERMEEAVFRLAKIICG